MIKVKGLEKRFGSHLVLQGVTFEAPAGSIFGFVGPNGAGKTTTIRILATLASADGGSAEVAGVSVGREPAEVRRILGYMPDFFGVYDRLTSLEYLEFYAACHKVPRPQRTRVAAQLLDLVNLADRRSDQVDTLSRGQKQRLGLARALVHDPKVLLLDEPASGLDPRARVELRELIRELSRMGKTILVSSHILPELEELCTWVGFIDGGRMVAAGPLDEVRDRVGTGRRFRLELAAGGDEALSQAETAIWNLPGVVAVNVFPDHVEVGAAEAFEEDEALVKLVQDGVRVRSFAPVAGDLSDAFMRLTAEEEGT